MAMYDGIAGGYAASVLRPLRRYTYHPFVEQYLRFYIERGARRVLDLGCGTGPFSIFAAQLGATVTGIDSSPVMIALAQGSASTLNDPEVRARLTFREGNMTDPTLFAEEERYDVVLLVNVLAHAECLRDLWNTIQNIRKVARKGRVIILMVDPYHYAHGYDQYGVTIEKATGEGAVSQVTLASYTTGEVYAQFPDTFWKETTIDRFFRWTDPIHVDGYRLRCRERVPVSEEGEAVHGKEFWEAYRRRPIYELWEYTPCWPE